MRAPVLSRVARSVEHGPLGGGLPAQDAQAGDANRARLGEADGPPDPTRVPVRVEAVPVLEHAGDVALGRLVDLRGAGDLDGEVVLLALAQGGGDLEGVRGEVALRVTEVGAVEPDVALVEEAVEGEPGPPALGGARGPRRSAGRAGRRRSRRTQGSSASGRAPRRPPTRCRRSRRRASCAAGPRRRRRPARSRSGPWSEGGYLGGGERRLGGLVDDALHGPARRSRRG